ncbi:MAG TPA: Sec-independent protein translocase protein TatB [Allosphingosinicella sp.]|nr:Sec-independent protein translocase protein TatB [Allosphingosinicella sp.]
MFGVDSSELLVVALIALLVIGPKDLPKAMRVVGHWVGRARGMARHFRSGFETMMREAELEEMEKKWREENERILREHPFAEPLADPSALDVPGEPPPPGNPEAEAPPAPSPEAGERGA